MNIYHSRNVKRQYCTNFLRPNCIKIAKQLRKRYMYVIDNGHFHANLFNLSKENFCSTPKHGHCKVCFNLPTLFQRKLCLLKYSFKNSLSFPLFSNQQVYLSTWPSNLPALTSAIPFPAALSPPFPFSVGFLFSDIAAYSLESRQRAQKPFEVF